MGSYNQDKALEQYDSSKYVTPDGYTSDIAVFTITTEDDGTKNTKKP